MALKIIVTTAGRAALVNAANTGTLPVTVTQIGVTATGFTATQATAALPGELKRIAAIAGAAVADDTIHVTLRDDSADVYSLRGVGLYLQDGTLFAVYGQAGVILEKSAQAALLLAADIRFADIDATSITFGDTSFANPPATTERMGVIEVATDAETIDGLDETRAVPPSALRAALNARFGIGAPSAFVKGLLSLATAALMRAALEIKGAALLDPGHGNGLDADTLDGQHGNWFRSWANLTGVPSTFAPSAHNHAAGEITSGTFANARIALASVVQHQAGLSIAFTQLTNLPSTWAPSAHFHNASDINAGVLQDGRIPSLEMTKITGLAAALAARAPLNAPSFPSGIKFGSTLPASAVDLSKHVDLYGGVLGWNIAANKMQAIVNGSVAGAFTSGGELEVTSNVRSGGWFITNAAVLALGTNNGGNVYLRPNGILSATGQLEVQPNGNVIANGQVRATGGFDNTSSQRVKNLGDVLHYSIDDLFRIDVRFGSFKTEWHDDGGRRRVFLVAENMAEVAPEVVTVGDDCVFEGAAVPSLDVAGTQALTLHFLKLVAQHARELDRRVAALEG